MNPITSFVKHYPLAIFFAIAYITSFVGGYLAEVYPSDIWAIFVYGPMIGAFVVTAIAEGRDGLRVWFGRIFRWRVGIQWYIVAFFLPLVIQLIALGLNVLIGAPLPTAAQWGSWPNYLMEFVFIFLFIGVAEEPGFRGFALDRLLKSHSALTATLMIWALHTIWHLPLFLNGSETLILIPIILAGSFVFTWIYQGTGGSVFLVMIFHAMVNTGRFYFSSLLNEAGQERQLILMLAVYSAFVIILVVKNWANLSRQPEFETESVTADPQLAAN
jgi:membrane protease YdiL (CAAX protease family)